MINLRLNKRWVVLLSTISLLLTFLYLLHSPPPALQEVKDRVKDRVTELAKNIPIPGRKNPNINLFKLQYEPRDSHPISFLISEADKRFQKHEDDISRTFQETVTKYRRKNERHPPPGFAEWYKFARKRDVHNIDDFEQIMGDLRPFWSIPAVKIRSEASHLSEQDRDINAIHIRSGKVVKTGISNWRLEGYTEMIQAFVDKLPDMDIPINAMDQPRVIVPWNGLQKSMAEEKQSRKEYPETINNFTQHMIGFRTWALDQDRRFRNQTGWMNATGKQFMKLAKTACPPDSYATGGEAIETAEQRWKILPGGFISNRNLSTNLCTMGLEIQELHGFMMASSAMRVTHKLVPIFGESKTSVNNDILIPAAMYWRHDKWGSYNVSHDLRWEEKKDIFYWRGMTTGGISTSQNWQSMHRSRLVHGLNASFSQKSEPKILGQSSLTTGVYDMAILHPEVFLKNHSDVAFMEAIGCLSNDCSFYHKNLAMVPQTRPSLQFESKFLLDVDGDGFSGQWSAHLQSRSLALKATIFREWHDSRLFAWRHFVPLDNRYHELLSVLTYFMGVGSPDISPTLGSPLVPRHEFEAKRLALQGREWSRKVLRKEDIEIYMYRLLLEYGRLIDDNRDRIGYSDSGAKIDDEVGFH